MAFDASKREIMHKLQEVIDKSPKGSVDAPIVDMITRLNAHPNYVTCSSCSGRIAVFCGVAQTPHDEDSHLITKGGKWLVSSHAPVTYDEFTSSVLADPTSLQGMVIFKHEPFIMHVQCRDEESAKALLQVGLACGFRESGVVLGNKRTMVAIRTTANAMEIPIALQGQLMVTDAYLRWILDIANQKFHANRSKTDKLFAAMRTSLFFDSPPAPTDASTCTSRLTQLHVTESSRLAISRAGHATVLGPNRKLCIVGGQGPTATNTTRLADLVVVDLSTQDQSSVQLDMPPRMYHSAVYDSVQDKMFVFGGRTSPTKPLGDLWTVDIAHGVAVPVTTQGTPPCPRWSHTATWVDGKLVVVGGRDATSVLNDVYVLSFTTSPPTWHQLASSDDARRFRHAAVAVGSCIYVFGGWQELDPNSQCTLNCITVLDTKTGAWSQLACTGAAPSARASAALCVVDNQHILLSGGTSTTGPCHDQLYSIDVQTKTWKQWPSFPSDALLVNHTMTYDEEAKAVVVVGGSCQCFGFGAVYSPAFILDTQTKLLSNKSTQSLTNHELLVVVVTKPRVKAIKTLVEALAVYDKSRRIQPIPDVAGYFTVPVMDSFRDHDHPELKHLPVTQAHVAAAAVAEHAQLEGTDEVPVGGEVVAEQVAVSTVHDSKVLLHAVLVAKDSVKSIKTHLERLSLYDKTRRIHPHADDMTLFAVPITTSSLPSDDLMLTALDMIVDDLRDVKPELNPTVVLHSLLQTFATAHDLAPVAAKFEFIADVLVLPKNSFTELAWVSDEAKVLWQSVCESSPRPLKRVARSADVDTNEKRQSHVELLYVHPSFTPTSRGEGWVQVRENGLTYAWDLQKVMFSSGNVTEKARMAKIGCAGETIVDMYAGIGYYVVPFLVHGHASYVHALEWNPDSVAALRFNLETNHVAHKCTVHPGDNRITGPSLGAIADRVNLGLLPKSEHGWPVAVQVLKPTGGWLHVHENVAIDDLTTWYVHYY
ncbi:hypothetical protein, variant [Aphanomyces astaci]|uniref:tRNA wybutosine-synthesizing protein 3 n=1 Tax=Aphanomyces astaci TaxID=112090 RepID=W4GFD7_APHAT|nr:hypothetical protein, variant [Aphanomyces astaci]ETV77774.1 hypothetical protein, variant [Aphanomyces astaci]|eukprot:XP_009832884.1 hypothetical protein, variant [Aphanomyces astaci]